MKYTFRDPKKNVERVSQLSWAEVVGKQTWIKHRSQVEFMHIPTKNTEMDEAVSCLQEVLSIVEEDKYRKITKWSKLGEKRVLENRTE